MKKIIALFLALFATVSSAVPLSSWPTWNANYPYIARQVPPNAMIVRGSGTNEYFVLEADPTTGEIPVSLSGASITIDFSGPTGDPVPADAGFVGGVDPGGDLRGLAVDTSGNLQVDVLTSALPTGAATLAEQQSQTTLLGTIDADTGLISTNTSTIASNSTNIDNKLNSLGQKTMAGSVPVVIASDQSDLPVAISASSTISVENLPATVSVNTGAADASTLRVSEASRSYADSVYYAYASGNVTTGAWVQLVASTAANINLLCITDQSGQAMELGVGAAASESRVFLIAPGFSGCVPLRIASAARISVRAVSATASSGAITLSGLN
jgi:hypothetical protein